MTKELQSDAVMSRLMEEAGKLGSHYAGVRLGTLSRLSAACDDILSGKAWRLAEEAGEADNPFSPDRPRINYALVGKYTAMRSRGRGEEAREWTGPTGGFVSRDVGLRAYVDARRVEASGNGKRRPRSRRAMSVEDALAKLPVEDRYLIREEIDRGRAWKAQLDLVAAAVKKWKSIDVDELILGPTAHDPADMAEPQIDAARAEILRQFLVRIEGQGFLDEFGLSLAKGSLKMSFSPGRVLITAQEMNVIAHMAGRPGGGGS